MTTRRTTLALALLLGCDAEPDPIDIPPDDPVELHQWLLHDGYAEWEAESEVHPADNAGGVRVFLNPVLSDSLADHNQVHPAGAAAVRELYEPDLATLRGWSALVKVEASADVRPDAWMWLEVFETDANAAPLVAALGASGCTGCHGQGVDFVQSTLPLP